MWVLQVRAQMEFPIACNNFFPSWGLAWGPRGGLGGGGKGHV